MKYRLLVMKEEFVEMIALLERWRGRKSALIANEEIGSLLQRGKDEMDGMG